MTQDAFKEAHKRAKASILRLWIGLSEETVDGIMLDYLAAMERAGYRLVGPEAYGDMTDVIADLSFHGGERLLGFWPRLLDAAPTVAERLGDE